MVHYKEFALTDDVAYNISNALTYCKEHGEDGLIFDQDTYRVKSELASEKFYSISNHGDAALKRICFLLEEFSDFTIDGGGSEFIFEDVMLPVAIDHCKNVTFRNFTFHWENTLNFQAKVVESAENTFVLEMQTPLPYYVYGGDLYVGDPKGLHQSMYFFNECDGETGWLNGETGDYFLNNPASRIEFSILENGLVKGVGVKRTFQPGNVLVFCPFTRCSANIFITGSENTHISDMILHSGIGMGVIAQNADSVSVERLSTRCLPGRYYTLNNDATHFVHCKGQISVRNCDFEGQMDDALNVHNIYLRIVGKTDRSLIVKFMHFETQGIDLFQEGGVIRTLKTDTLLPYGEHTIRKVRKLNLSHVELFLDSTEGIEVGDNIEEVSWQCDVLFENCLVKNNRARGMLLASAGKTIIRNNHFQNPGSPIRFESEGRFWFEAGGVGEVLITDNLFENCKSASYPGWGNAVIEVAPREKTEEGRYYHNTIRIENNTFRGCHGILAAVNNTEHFTFTGNRLEDNQAEAIRCFHIGKAETDLS